MSLGKASLENRDARGALTAFEAAVAARPDSAPALRNLARAQLLSRDSDAALEALARAAALEGDATATEYLTGIALARSNRTEEAIPHLERAVELDPSTAALRYQLAAAYQATGRHARAVEQLHETMRLDPFHATAAYRLSRYARAQGDRRAFERWDREFRRLRKIQGDEARSAELLEVCRYTAAELAPSEEPSAEAPAIEVRFTDATDTALAPLAGRALSAVAVLDVPEEGGYTLIGTTAEGAMGAMTWSGEEDLRYERLAPRVEGTFQQLVVGNFFDRVAAGERYDPATQALNDVLLLGADGSRLLLRTGPREFQDVTAQAGLDGLKGQRARWVDAEHDGDLDLLVAGDEGLELWQNQGDGSFEPVGATIGLDVSGPLSDVAAADLEGDVAVDLVAARGERPTAVLRGIREGRFETLAEPPGPWPAATRVLLDDLDNDAFVDAALVGKGEIVIVFGGKPGRLRVDLEGLTPRAATLLDADNDGRLDISVAGDRDGRSFVRLFRNVGGGIFDEVGDSTGLSQVAVPATADLLAADIDADGDSDLLLVAEGGGMRLLRNDGGNANRQLKLRLVGTKTNPSGIGTQVEVRADGFRAARAVSGAPIEIGVGSFRSLDAVRTLWTNGVVDNQIEVEVPQHPLTVVEKNVATGSCPFLYAWDGRRFRFVTDVLGNSPLGLPAKRGELLAADPDELVVVGDESELKSRHGAFELVVTSEFREVLYLDEARLVAVDHAPELEVHATDKLAPPPFPPSEIWALGDRLPLLAAIGTDGSEVGAALNDIDGSFAPAGEPLPPPFRGVTRPWTLTLDFGLLDGAEPLVLALTGWLQYGDASTNIALSQAAAGRGPSLSPPRLEAETAAGGFQPVPITVGMPAGKTKTILCDLSGKLPPGARRLRLSSNVEIHWDRIALFARRGAEAVQRREVGALTAELAWRGFSQLASRTRDHPTTPDYDHVSSQPPWRTTLEGWSTRYGDVLELVSRRDGRLVLVNAGDAVTLRFPAGLPPPERGRVRTFFLYLVGWDKDGDHNVAGGDRVEPLPEAGAGGDDWRERYNTRWVDRHRFDPRGPESASR